MSSECSSHCHTHACSTKLEDQFENSSVDVPQHPKKKVNHQHTTDLRGHKVIPPTLLRKAPWIWLALAEMVGTFFMTFIGTGVVASAVTFDSQVGLWQVAVVWGFSITIAIYLVGNISGAHLNPAVTLTLVVFRPKDFSARVLLYYIPAQVLGAFLAGLMVYGIWESPIVAFELRNNITRGYPGSQLSAMMFGEYFPNPGNKAIVAVSVGLAFGVEALGTFLIMLVILALTDYRNQPYQTAIVKHLTPYFIGMTVACAISIFAPFTQAGFNPARDFGPRLASLIFGWGVIAIPGGSNNGFWIYLIAPFVGALVAGAIYKISIGRHFKEKCITGQCKCD